MATPEQSTKFALQYYVLKLPFHLFIHPRTCMFSPTIYVQEDLTCIWKMLFILENGCITLSSKAEVLWRRKITSCTIISHLQQVTNLYMKFMQKKHFRRTGKDRQNSNKDKSTEWRKQTDRQAVIVREFQSYALHLVKAIE